MKIANRLAYFFISVIFTFAIFVNKAHATQGVDQTDAWLTMETEHFLIHYTELYREWANTAAYELEASVEAINKHQQRSLDMKVDVIVFDAFNTSNGFAMPFSARPVMALYTTPPNSDSIISNSTSWQQLLALHEYVHLVHIGQPSRSNWKRSLTEFWDILDIMLTTANFPRWAAEGYATLLESQLTGRGRVFDDYSEAMVRQFALEGALPSYGQLSQVEGSYQIGRMAYLVGSRYLAWLEDKYSPETLDKVWTRLKGKQRRDFNKAFEGAFGERPDFLYQQFVVEYTAKVFATHGTKPNGKLWFDADYHATSPALSPKHDMIALVESNKDRDVFINVYKTAENEAAKTKFNKKQQEIIKNDPEDFVDVEPKVFEKERVYQLQQHNWAGLRQPRWQDENNIIFGAYSYDKVGHLHHDLFKWHLPTGKISQLTVNQNIRRFDIVNDVIIAEQIKYGFSSLVMIDLSEPAPVVKALNKPSLKNSYDFPRFNPNNHQQFLYLESRPNKPWRMMITELSQVEGGIEVPMPKDYQFLSYPSWSKDGANVLFVAGVKNNLSLYQYQLESGELTKLDDGQQMMAWPMQLESSDTDSTNQVLYLQMTSRGMEIRNSQISTSTPVTPNVDEDYQYLLALTDSKVMMPPAFDFDEQQPAGEQRKYNRYQQDYTFSLSAPYASASSGSDSFGIQGSDFLGLFRWGVKYMVGSDGLGNGWFANARWQQANKLPFDISINVHNYEITPHQQNLSEWLQPEVLSLSTQMGQQELSGMSLRLTDDYRPLKGLYSLYQGRWSVGVSQRQEFTYKLQSMSLSHSQRWLYDQQSWGVKQFSNISLTMGHSEQTLVVNNEQPLMTEDWINTNVELGLAAHYAGYHVQFFGRVAEFDKQGITQFELGGMYLEASPDEMQSTHIIAQELPAYFQVGSKYEEYVISMYGEDDSNQFYYKKPYMDDVSEATIWGFKGKTHVNAFRAGLDGLVLEYGIADVTLSSSYKGRSDYHDTNFWVSLQYVF